MYRSPFRALPINHKIDSCNVGAIVLLFVTLSRQFLSSFFVFINLNVIMHSVYTDIVVMGFPIGLLIYS
jgi:hypothetical protein